MTILVAYVPRPEGRAALDKGIEIAKRRQEPMLIVNASPGGQQEDTSLAPGFEVEQIEAQLAAQGIQGEFNIQRFALEDVFQRLGKGDQQLQAIGIKIPVTDAVVDKNSLVDPYAAGNGIRAA